MILGFDAHLSKTEPLELVRNVRFPFESENTSAQSSELHRTSVRNRDSLFINTYCIWSDKTTTTSQYAILKLDWAIIFQNEPMDCASNETSGEQLKKRKNCKLKRSHISVIPGMPESYKCNICDKTFKSPTAQRYHDSCLTGIKPYQCSLCDRSFVKQSHFQYHERTHTGYKPYECSFCGKAFPQRNKLNRHLHSHQSKWSG